jgi:hypothetical protein
LLGALGCPNPPLDDEFELFPNPEEDVPNPLLFPLPVPKALPLLLPLCPLRFGVPCCPKLCS